MDIETLSFIFNVAFSGFNVILETCGTFVQESKRNSDNNPIREGIVVSGALIQFVLLVLVKTLGSLTNVIKNYS